MVFEAGGSSSWAFDTCADLLEDTSRILDIRHGINRRIKETFEAEGIDMAFPTITVQQA